MPKHKKRKVHAVTAHPYKPSPSATRKQKPPTPKTAKPKPTPSPAPLPFSPTDRILLLGEGDFSFAQSLVLHHACTSVTATSLDSADAITEKFSPQAPAHISFLASHSQTTLHSIDATKLRTTKPLLRQPRFDTIIFNFPHVGGKSTDVNRQVRFNQELLVKFFEGAPALLVPETGTVVVTLFEGEPYTLWNIRDLARHTGLEVVRSFVFDASVYPGYKHARTLGNVEGGGGWKGEDRAARSFVFRVKAEVGGRGGKGGRKGGESEDEDGD